MKVALAVYGYGGLDPALVDSITRIEAQSRKAGHQLLKKLYFSDALISRARCLAATEAMATDCDVWFQLDHDMSFKAEDFFATVEKAWETQAVVGGIYSYRCFGHGFPFSPLDEGLLRAGLPFGTETLVESAGVPTGFMAVPISVLKRAEKRLLEDSDPDMRIRRVQSDAEGNGYTTLFRPIEVKLPNGIWTYPGEDWAFCARMRYCGAKVFAYLRPWIGHAGRYVFTPADAARRLDG